MHVTILVLDCQVWETGFEPARSLKHMALNHVCLPFPPLPQSAGGGTRTPTGFHPETSKVPLSTNSSTPAQHSGAKEN